MTLDAQLSGGSDGKEALLENKDLLTRNKKLPKVKLRMAKFLIKNTFKSSNHRTMKNNCIINIRQSYPNFDQTNDLTEFVTK